MNALTICQARVVCQDWNRRREFCGAPAVALVEGLALCWLHHATLELDRATLWQLIEGKRKKSDG